MLEAQRGLPADSPGSRCLPDLRLRRARSGRRPVRPTEVQSSCGRWGPHRRTWLPWTPPTSCCTASATHPMPSTPTASTARLPCAGRGRARLRHPGRHRAEPRRPRYIVIADASGPMDLAGVMGGDPTKVTDATPPGSCWKAPGWTRRWCGSWARRRDLHTDASHHWPRRGSGHGAGQPGTCSCAGWKAAEVLACGRSDGGAGRAAAAGAAEAGAGADRRRAGEPCPILPQPAAAGLPGGRREPGRLHVVPPSWRQDLGIAEDLAEEVLRMRGYERMPVALPAARRSAPTALRRLSAGQGGGAPARPPGLPADRDLRLHEPRRMPSCRLSRRGPHPQQSAGPRVLGDARLAAPSLRGVARANLRQGAPW